MICLGNGSVFAGYDVFSATDQLYVGLPGKMEAEMVNHGMLSAGTQSDRREKIEIL